jgi:drug/metabolite transporter (DMT)-like permease
MIKLKEYIADLSLVSVAIAWGSTFVVVREAITTTPVYSFLFLRFGFSFVLLLPLLFAYKKFINKDSVLSGVILGGVFFAGYATQTYGLVFTQSSIVAFITGLYVVMVPMLLYFVFKQHLSFYSILGTVIATFGLYFLTITNGFDSFGIGEFLSLACAVFFAIHIIYTSIFSKRHNTFVLVITQLFIVALLSLIFSIFYDSYTIPAVFDKDLIIALIITSIFATVYALLIQTYMQKFTTPAKVAVIFTIEPLSAAIIGYFYSHEALTYNQIIGGILIIAAMLSVELSKILGR